MKNLAKIKTKILNYLFPSYQTLHKNPFGPNCKYCGVPHLADDFEQCFLNPNRNSDIKSNYTK